MIAHLGQHLGRMLSFGEVHHFDDLFLASNLRIHPIYSLSKMDILWR